MPVRMNSMEILSAVPNALSLVIHKLSFHCRQFLLQIIVMTFELITKNGSKLVLDNPVLYFTFSQLVLGQWRFLLKHWFLDLICLNID